MILLILKYREEALKNKRKSEGNSEDETQNEEIKEDPADGNTSTMNQVKPFEIDIEKPVIDFKMMLYLTTTKFGIKSMEIIKTLPSHLIIMLKTIVIIFDEK
uniref:Uncharacterized protein n=1 Tax=Euplotes harpa TaxID=151035 RepID=A0A7S3N539_9SPIT|mmetsp:Transcript_22475/g.25864  ORF Transcript_22475/g.25864 Transcript_22475/m.25864 type:complete len:102 (+) Transcript_22475:514-819(+)